MAHEKNESITIETLLSITALGQIEALKVLLPKYKGKVDLNETDEYGHFLAILAAKQNNLEMLKLFVEYGAGPSLNPNFKDGGSRNVLGWANKHKNEEMKKLVIMQTMKHSSQASLPDNLSQTTIDELEKFICGLEVTSKKSSSMPSLTTPKIKGH